MSESVNKFRWEMALWEDLSHDESLFATAMGIAVHADAKGQRSFPGHRRLAEARRVTPRTVSRHVGKLVELGWIGVVASGAQHGRKGHATIFRLAYPRHRDPVTGEPREGAEGSEPGANGDAESSRTEDIQVSPVPAESTGTGDIQVSPVPAEKARTEDIQVSPVPVDNPRRTEDIASRTEDIFDGTEDIFGRNRGHPDVYLTNRTNHLEQSAGVRARDVAAEVVPLDTDKRRILSEVRRLIPDLTDDERSLALKWAQRDFPASHAVRKILEKRKESA